MGPEEYKRTQSELLALARRVEALDLDGFVEAINTAEAAAPFFSPTAYMLGAENLTLIKRLAEGCRKFKSALLTDIEKAQMLANVARAHGIGSRVRPLELAEDDS